MAKWKRNGYGDYNNGSHEIRKGEEAATWHLFVGEDSGYTNESGQPILDWEYDHTFNTLKEAKAHAAA